MHVCPCPRHKKRVNHVRNSSLVSSRWSFPNFFVFLFLFLQRFTYHYWSLYIVPIKILFPIKIIVGQVKKEMIQKTESRHLHVSVLCSLSFRTFDNSYILWKSSKLVVAPCFDISCWVLRLVKLLRQVFFSVELLLKQIHTLFSVFHPEKGGSL